MRMTEMMTQSMMGGFFGGLGFGRKQPKKNIVRQDESTEDIMKRMNRLSEEIGEKHERSKYDMSSNKSNRVYQISVIVGVLGLLVVTSVLMQCYAAKSEKTEEDSDMKKAVSKSVSKGD